jgi:DNA-binding beta-propeller fold protein YncE
LPPPESWSHDRYFREYFMPEEHSVSRPPEPSDREKVVGSGEYRYQVVDPLARLPATIRPGEACGAATDSQDRVYVFNRGEHPVIVLDAEGEFLGSWGEGAFTRPHGIFVGPDDAVYLVDDLGHSVRQFTSEGKQVRTIGPSGKPADTGVQGIDYRTIRRAGPPFNVPTNLALSPSGEFYVTDGYGNARVHRFSADCRLLDSWGEPGSGPGEFQVPHGIAIDRRGVVYVADRENSRIQLFGPGGEWLGEWMDVARPCEVFIDGSGRFYVAELGFRAGRWPGSGPPPPGSTGGRVSIFDREGGLLARWGGGDDPCAPGDFFAPHDIWVNSRGDIYVAEVTLSAGGNRGMVPPTCHTLQKFVRLP